MQKKNSAFTLALALLLIVTTLTGLTAIAGMDSVQAAPPLAIPTPASVTYSADNTQFVTFFTSEAITQDTTSSAFDLSQAEGLDIHHVVDQATATNTITITLQFSNDQSNWVDGVNVLANSAVDVNDLLQFNNFGRYTRLNVDVLNTNTVTLTHVSAVGRR